MNNRISLDDISIRTELQPGDIGRVIHMHSALYGTEYRGIGLGSRLMKLYMDFLCQCGYKKSYLWTTHELSTAASLYKRVGFRLTEERESASFGKPLREQRYDLVLL